ncbi:tRNA threonylcarbamoyladenosine biosynthesis protein TsaE [Methylomarinovum tepidoasis]|uniref:tRNA threonylcarbamoyladenosine biosynthesis protein TsaE n=1 Tax=Methylomarinovum tepidoasis TaxID=2840183 RepID=A0AAU9CFM6_9GAMM|nr:tRNA (adenosine(37)-N6)-threonylcarbamoyltransferase complex ATPase subunit type 1 TsaE [Methylomarinovum sp. IN45]BCX89626.1 tRNA threonylcarbamoyladenosine biosynthesis protein TsaE [Methylomarinovum sp. IN45]
MAASPGQRLSAFLPDPQATARFGERLARCLEAGAVAYLEGPLGAGKTTLVRALLSARGYRGRVKSPTYTLVETYPGVVHFDLYRLADPEELEWLGVRDYLDGETIVLAEWAEKGRGVLPPPDLVVRLTPEGEGRRVTVTAAGPRGEPILRCLAQI